MDVPGVLREQGAKRHLRGGHVLRRGDARKHAESARDEAAGDESSSTVSILLNSFLLIYLFTHPIFFFLLFGVVGSFRKGFRSQVREGEAYERFQTRALRLPRRAGYVGCV